MFWFAFHKKATNKLKFRVRRQLQTFQFSFIEKLRMILIPHQPLLMSLFQTISSYFQLVEKPPRNKINRHEHRWTANTQKSWPNNLTYLPQSFHANGDNLVAGYSKQTYRKVWRILQIISEGFPVIYHLNVLITTDYFNLKWPKNRVLILIVLSDFLNFQKLVNTQW